MHDREHDRDDPSVAPTILIGAISVILLFVVVVLLETLYHRTAEAERVRKVVETESQELRRLRSEQLETLNGYRWVDRENAVAAIPIERAMELEVRDERGGADGS